MAIPTRIRDTLMETSAGRLVVTAHTEERCLLVYPEPEWLQILPNIQKLPSLNKHARRIQRLLIGYSHTLEMDANGRILLPPTLRDYANIDKKTMLVGLGNKLELWSEDSWNALLDEPVDGEMPAELQNLSF